MEGKGATYVLRCKLPSEREKGGERTSQLLERAERENIARKGDKSKIVRRNRGW